MSDPIDLEPVSRESTAAIVAGRLREAIMHGTFRPAASSPRSTWPAGSG